MGNSTGDFKGNSTGALAGNSTRNGEKSRIIIPCPLGRFGWKLIGGCQMGQKIPGKYNEDIWYAEGDEVSTTVSCG